MTKKSKAYRTAQKYLSSKRSPIIKRIKKGVKYTGKKLGRAAKLTGKDINRYAKYLVPHLKKEHPTTRGHIKLIKHIKHHRHCKCRKCK